MAPFPCSAPPNSAERLLCYQWRRENNFELFHPDDAGPVDGRRPPPDGGKAIYHEREPRILKDPRRLIG
jgi:hypothetical protein